MRTYDTTKKSLADIILDKNRRDVVDIETAPVTRSPRIEEIKQLIDDTHVSSFAEILDYKLLPSAFIETFFSLVNSGDLKQALLVIKDANIFVNRHHWVKTDVSSIIQDCLDMSYNDFINTPLSERENHPHMRILKMLLLTRRARQFVNFYPLPPPLNEEIPNEQIFNPYQFEKDLLKVTHYSFIPDRKVNSMKHYKAIRKIVKTARALHSEGYKCLELSADKTMSGKTELVYLDAEKQNDPMVTL